MFWKRRWALLAKALLRLSIALCQDFGALFHRLIENSVALAHFLTLVKLFSKKVSIDFNSFCKPFAALNDSK